MAGNKRGKPVLCFRFVGSEEDTKPARAVAHCQQLDEGNEGIQRPTLEIVLPLASRVDANQSGLMRDLPYDVVFRCLGLNSQRAVDQCHHAFCIVQARQRMDALVVEKGELRPWLARMVCGNAATAR